MRNYKILTVLILSLGFVFSQSTTKKIGNTYYNSDGSTTKKIGNTYYNSNGSTTKKIGNTYYNSNGSTTKN